MNQTHLKPSFPARFWWATALSITGVAIVPFSAVTGTIMFAVGGMALAAGAWLDRRQIIRLTNCLNEVSADRQKQAEQLKDAQSRYQQVLNQTIDAMFFIDPSDGSLLEVNRQAEVMLGYTCEEFGPLTFDILFPGRHRRRFLKLVRRILKDGEGEETHLQFRRKDGSLFYGDIQARLGWLGSRRVVHGCLRDVTENVDLAMELHRHNKHFELLNEIALLLTEGSHLSPILATVLDQVVDSLAVAGGGIFLLRHRGSEMELAFQHGIPVDVATELNLLRPGEGLAGRVAASGRPQLSVDLSRDQRRACTSVLTDGWGTFLGVPLSADDDCLGVLFVFDRGSKRLNRNDLRLLQSIGRQLGPLVKKTELFDELQWQHRLNQASLRELERSRSALRVNLKQLEDNHRKLQSLEQMKSAFLALASHELRTPLAVVWSGAELLQDSPAVQFDTAERRALNVIIQGCRRLRDLTDDLLEAARLEANAVYLAHEDFSPRQLLEQLVVDFQSICEQRGLSCAIGTFPDHVILRGDAHHLGRAVRRLLENAIKFTPEGGWVRIEGTMRNDIDVDTVADRLRRFSAAFFSTPRAKGFLEIRICDNGIGLDPGEEEQIFSKFYTGSDIASHSSSRERFGGKGVGLGLTLARGLIEAHGGMLWAESAGRNRGSAFCMLLPLPLDEACLVDH